MRKMQIKTRTTEQLQKKNDPKKVQSEKAKGNEKLRMRPDPAAARRGSKKETEQNVRARVEA